MAKKKNRIPKKVAGVKVPKMLRKSGMLRSLLGSQFGRDLLANALTAAAGAVAAVLVAEREEIAHVAKKAGRKGARSTGRAVSLGREAVESAASAVMGVVSDAAHSLVPGSDTDRQKERPKNAARH